MKKILIIGIAAMALGACTHHTYVANESADTSKGSKNVAFGYSSDSQTAQDLRLRKPIKIMNSPASNMIPNATAFRMNGDYANNVAVTLSPSGELIYFPAPTDITADSAPQQLTDGWWLNNQGLGPNSVFTKYTFAEYAALPEAPSPQQIKQSIIPGASVTQFVELPVKVGNTQGNMEEIITYLKDR